MKPIFRNAMFGFNKEDVINFVAKQNNQFEDKVKELREQLEKEAVLFQEEKEALMFDRDELESLRKKQVAQKDMIENIKKLADQIGEQKEELLAEFSCGELAFDRMNDEMKDIKSRLTEAMQYREKAGRFDKLANVLGEIFAGKSQTTEIASEPECEETIDAESSSGIDVTQSIARQRETILKLQGVCDELMALLVLMCEEK